MEADSLPIPLANLQENIDISNHLTMGIGGVVRLFCVVREADDVEVLCRWADERALEVLVLGGGSNCVVSDEGFDGLVIKIENKGYKDLPSDGTSVEVEVAAGEDWDDFVKYTIERGYWGCENLSLIPGTVGATPVQNVGAFGQEVKNIISSVRCYDRREGVGVVLRNEECGFGFRESIFNGSHKGRYVILSVRFKLSLKPTPILSRRELRKNIDWNTQDKSLQSQIRDVVICYRTSGRNLPMGDDVGTAGTFFRTAVVGSYVSFVRLVLGVANGLGVKKAFMFAAFGVKYRSRKGFRIPSKMLIKWCGLSSLRVGAVELFANNPAVVLTRKSENPSSHDLLSLIEIVQFEVFRKTGVKIPVEPTLVGLVSSEGFRGSGEGGG